MSITTPWASPPQDFRYKLVPGTVHVWRVLLDDSPERASRYRAYLSTDERARAERCRIPHPQFQFTITRGILRMLLSRYLGVPSAQLRFETQAQGKPSLIPDSSFSLQFNVSHTRGMAMIALTLQQAVGIDVEWIDRKLQDDDIAGRYFSSKESTYLASLPPSERSHQFFSYWTCKEAFLKMQGKGIPGGLAQCELSIDPDQPEVELTLLDQQGQREPCSLYRMNVGTEHIGALAIACPTAEISFWNWEDEILSRPNLPLLQ